MLQSISSVNLFFRKIKIQCIKFLFLFLFKKKKEASFLENHHLSYQVKQIF